MCNRETTDAVLPALRLRRLAAACLPVVAMIVGVLLTACSTPGPAAPEGAPSAAAEPPAPAAWEPPYWDRAMREAQQARERGARDVAERACARGILYVQAQAIKVLYQYAEMLDRQNYGAGVSVRGKAQKLEQARDASQAGKPSNYLGFDPAAELKSYADFLSGLKRGEDALKAEALASAYRYAQDANVRRAALRREGRDPLGEC
jgi:hypothetical protein